MRKKKRKRETLVKTKVQYLGSQKVSWVIGEAVAHLHKGHCIAHVCWTFHCGFKKVAKVLSVVPKLLNHAMLAKKDIKVVDEHGVEACERRALGHEAVLAERIL